jgi:hypothetical protein
MTHTTWVLYKILYFFSLKYLHTAYCESLEKYCAIINFKKEKYIDV